MSSSSKGACNEAYVLDAAALFASLPLRLHDTCYTTPLVATEVIDQESRKSLEYALVSGKLVVTEPPRESIEEVKKAAENIGELSNLSEADISVLALTHSLLSMCSKVVVITDDKSVQNVALHLGAQVHGIKRRAIRKPRKATYICPACGYKSNKAGTCPICGHKLCKKLKNK